MDLLEHAAGVWARKYLVLAAALLVAVAVYGWRASAPDEYVSSTTVQVRVPETNSDPSAEVDYYAETVTGLATSRTVVERALPTGSSDLDVADAVDRITAKVASEPGFVTITGFGPTGEEAAALADSLASVLIEQVTQEQAADLAAQRAAITDSIAEVGRERRKLAADGDTFAIAALSREREALLGSLRTVTDKASWRLAVVEPADVPESPASPAPLRDALLAFIIALILGAELVVLSRAWRGSLSARDAAKDAGDAAGVPAVSLDPDDRATALATLLPVLETQRAITVVQHGPVAHAHTVGLLTDLLAARGDEVLLVDATPGRPTVHREFAVSLTPGLGELSAATLSADTAFGALPHARHVHVLAAGRPGPGEELLAETVKSAPHARVTVAASVETIDDLLDLAGELDGAAVLDVDAGTTRAQIRSDVAALRGLGLDVVAVTVSHGARIERSRRQAPLRRAAWSQSRVDAS